MRSLKLYDETALIFDQTTVPDPPRHTFSKDLDELGTLWSDDHPDFKKKNEGKCIVKIQDCGIAYKYWPIVFKHKIKGCEDKRWKLLKKTWYVWSLIGKCYTTVGKAAFWVEFSQPDGTRMLQTHIKDTLKARNVARSGQSTGTCS